MADVTELGIRVTMENGEVAAQQLDAIADAGDRADQSNRRLAGSTDGLTRSQRFLMEQSISLDRVLLALDGPSKALANIYADSRPIVLQHAQALELTGSAYRDNRALVLQHMQALEMDAEMARVVGSIYTENRAIVLAHAQALEIDAAASTEAAAATGVHGLNLGRVNMELGTAAGRILGVNTAASRFVAMLGGSLNGYPQMIALTGAVVLLGAAYEHFTEKARKAKEEQDKLTDSLRKWYETKERGEAGERSMGVDKTLTLIAQQQAELAKLQATQTPGGVLAGDVNKNRIAELKRQIADEQRMIADGRRDIDRTWEQSFLREREAQIGALAERLKFNAQDEAARRQALALLKEDQALYAQYLTLPASDENSARVAAMAKQITALTEALNPKVHVTTPGSGGSVRNPTIAGLDKQLEEMRKVSVEENIANVQRENEIKLVGMVGYAHDVLVAQQKAEIETIKALSTLSGIALRERLATIRADEDADIAKAKLVRTLKEELDTRTMLNDITKDVTAIGKRNEAIANAQITAAAKKIKDAQAYQDELEKIARNGIERIISHGMKSYQDFFGDVFKMFESLMDRMEKRAKELGQEHASGALFKGLGIASAGLGGALAGYDIGHSTGSAVLGAAGGALSGFELGNAIVPGIGGVVGALAGFAGGLFGASKAAKEAAAAMTELKQVQVAQTLADWRAQITGTAADQRAAAEMDLRVTYLSIRQKIEEAEGGKKMADQRNKDLADAATLYAEAQGKLKNSTDALADSMLNAVQGYRYQAAIFGAAPVHAAPPAPPAGTGRSVYGGGTTARRGTGSSGADTPAPKPGGNLTVNVVMPNGRVLAKVVLDEFQDQAGRMGKFTTQWSEIHTLPG